ncbi:MULTISPECIES: DUF4351 domain-containing protein [unclassified Duganella]|uniref:DUF4351 domain-containing protein n=1 Tax=unclassified Duganella TaxID=2636909 RepID=UPI0006FF77BC|nr:MULTISPECIES: DUF4351 domain-containing protein [unclassified Duganella]KQV54317.1 hypothetical protein ASD07_07245 [Duganella sp. Root336D2]KRC03443.1 hypothetical protein ASE26_00970 [Duganella sp. Root198D2]
MADNYDSPWKRALKHDLRDFIAFFFPQYCELIDWLLHPCMRDKELEQSRRDGRPHSLIADLLASVFLLDGREILLHIEVQAQRDPNLAKRILDYNYGLYKDYMLPVASLVVLADTGKRWRQDSFHNEVLGTQMGIRFAVAKLSAYAELVDELLLERNVFAWVTAAHLLARQTHARQEARYAAKWRLVRLLYERGWHKRRIIDLFTVVHWLMPLSVELERRLRRNIGRLERRYSVEWLSEFDQLRLEKREKRGIRIGLAEGRQEGLQKGLQEGLQAGAAKVLERLLYRRFGVLSPTVQKRLARASPEQLAQWGEAVLDAQTLKQVFSARL